MLSYGVCGICRNVAHDRSVTLSGFCINVVVPRGEKPHIFQVRTFFKNLLGNKTFVAYYSVCVSDTLRDLFVWRISKDLTFSERSYTV